MPKITCHRLVPDQRSLAPSFSIVIERHLHLLLSAGDFACGGACEPGGALPVAVATDHPGLRLAMQVLEEIYGRPALPVRMGATIPIGGIFSSTASASIPCFSPSRPWMRIITRQTNSSVSRGCGARRACLDTLLFDARTTNLTCERGGRSSSCSWRPPRGIGLDASGRLDDHCGQHRLVSIGRPACFVRDCTNFRQIVANCDRIIYRMCLLSIDGDFLPFYRFDLKLINEDRHP